MGAGFLLALLAAAGLQMGALRDPGLNENQIHAAWKAFDEDPARFPVGNNYPFMEHFRKAAQRHHLPVSLLLAVARGESSFNPRAAREDSRCYGLMQIQYPGTAKDMGVQKKEDLYRPEINIEAGARYLAWLKKRYGSTYLALAAYNYGPGRVSKGNVPDGAQWYAAYIYRDNLLKILETNYEERQWILVNEYTHYRAAVHFQDFWSKKVSDVSLEVKKSNKYTYDLYIAYKDEADRLRSVDRFMKITGFRPMGLD
ncbi:MAG: transglycosylase SLT domain-containing protein [Pseudomonadota bacterium]